MKKKKLNKNITAGSFLVVFLIAVLCVLWNERKERILEQHSTSPVMAKINSGPQ